MRWSCGALAKYPNQSPIFRFITDLPPGMSRSHAWPEHIQQEATTFICTPGISWRWVRHVLNIQDDRRWSLMDRNPEWVKKGKENLLTATYDDALHYCQRAPYNSQTPMWAVPFYLEDKKSGIGIAELERRWGHRSKASKKDFMLY